jgi:DNA modification methylase
MPKRSRVYQGDCLDVMKTFPDCYIDLTVTSPPYDNLREYKGFTFDFEGIADELYRVTKKGGVVVWVVGDATIKGSETGTSFRQALYFKECGFNLHDTMIWDKGLSNAVGSLVSRYAPVFEYVFVLSKCKPKTFNPIKDRKNKTFGRKLSGCLRQKDGTMKPLSSLGKLINRFGQRFNIWTIPNVGKSGTIHPATFPEQLANDHILSWSNEGDMVLDPFAGSGTTLKMSKLNKRFYIGIEISKEYCEIIYKRLAGTKVK